MAGLVDVEPLFVRQAIQKFLIGLLQCTSHLTDDRRQLPARDRQADDIADELPDGRERSMADPLEVGDQGRQSGPNQAAAFDPDWKRGLVELLATRAPSRMTAVLLNRQRHLLDVNLLDHTGLAPGRGFQPMAAPGTKIDIQSKDPALMASGGNGSRSCLGCPGWPPILR